MLVCTIDRYNNELIMSESDPLAFNYPLKLLILILSIPINILNSCIKVCIKTKHSQLVLVHVLVAVIINSILVVIRDLMINQLNVGIDTLIIEPLARLQPQE